MLAAMKFLRGGGLDIFGYNRHRRMERDLIAWYRGTIEQVMERLTPENQAAGLEIAALPDQIRGYERIKEESIAKTKALAAEKLAQMRQIPVLTTIS
jgi:indolepyruvate ferredoxin oxidoreductase